MVAVCAPMSLDVDTEATILATSRRAGMVPWSRTYSMMRYALEMTRRAWSARSASGLDRRVAVTVRIVAAERSPAPRSAAIWGLGVVVGVFGARALSEREFER